MSEDDTRRSKKEEGEGFSGGQWLRLHTPLQGTVQSLAGELNDPCSSQNFEKRGSKCDR